MKILYLRWTILLFTASGIGFHSCSTKHAENIRVIDIVGNLNNTEDIKLSDIADEVSYIPLETKAECLLTEGYNIISSSEFFFISDGDKPLFVFDLEGRFVRKIGSIGNGPGEFSECIQFHLDEQKREVYIFNQNREFCRYTWEGDYLGTTKLPYRSFLYYGLNQKEFLFYHIIQNNRDSLYFRMYLTDNEFNFKGAFSQEKEFEPAYGSFGAKVWDYQDQNLIQIELCDTIYRIDGSNLVPGFFLDFGKERISSDFFNNSESQDYNSNNYITYYSITSINNIWTINFHYQEKTRLGIINPIDRQVVFAAEIDTTRDGLINDLDGGPGYFPFRKFQDDRWLVSIPAFEFQNWFINEDFNDQKILDPEANARLKIMAGQIKENDNPVIMIIKPKSNLEIWN